MVGYLLTLDNPSASVLDWVLTASHSMGPTPHGKQVVQAQARYHRVSYPSSANGPLRRSPTLTGPLRYYHLTHRRVALLLYRHLRSRPVQHTQSASAMAGLIRRILQVGLRKSRVAHIRTHGAPLVQLCQRNVEGATIMLPSPLQSQRLRPESGERSIDRLERRGCDGCSLFRLMGNSNAVYTPRLQDFNLRKGLGWP
jgi:hypothetical protein